MATTRTALTPKPSVWRTASAGIVNSRNKTTISVITNVSKYFQTRCRRTFKPRRSPPRSSRRLKMWRTRRAERVKHQHRPPKHSATSWCSKRRRRKNPRKNSCSLRTTHSSKSTATSSRPSSSACAVKSAFSSAPVCRTDFSSTTTSRIPIASSWILMLCTLSSRKASSKLFMSLASIRHQ